MRNKPKSKKVQSIWTLLFIYLLLIVIFSIIYYGLYLTENDRFLFSSDIEQEQQTIVQNQAEQDLKRAESQVINKNKLLESLTILDTYLKQNPDVAQKTCEIDTPTAEARGILGSSSQLV